jgi:hypothetical protein
MSESTDDADEIERLTHDLHAELSEAQNSLEYHRCLARYWRNLARIRNDEMLRLTDENSLLRAALKEAIEEVEFWGAYAGDYFKDKHNLDGALAKLRAVLASN